MGPLVPEIFGNEFNFVIALLIGILFGYILEQAGFSTSKKLAGLFYGYDFVVLRVFFTAGVTAMIGVAFLSYFGLLDWNMTYINPTFLWSAIIGGLIMGVGFILGGFCPGTSVAAAAIGKIDAMIFILGAFLGVFFFAEFYSTFEGLYSGFAYGELRVDKFFGTNPGIVVFAMASMAFLAFFFTSKIENKVNKIDSSKLPFFKREENRYIPFGIIYLTVAFILVFLPSREEAVANKLDAKVSSSDAEIHSISSLELAYKILDEDRSFVIVDLREKTDTLLKALPAAKNIPFKDLFGKENTDFIKKSFKSIVFVDNDGTVSRKAVAYANELGMDKAIALSGGLKKFYSTFSNASMEMNTTDLNLIAENKFKSKVPEQLEILRLKYLEAGNKQENKPKKKAGGC